MAELDKNVIREMHAHLQTLQLEPGASLDDIKAAYRQLAKQYHSDKHSGETGFSNDLMQKLNKSYTILTEKLSHGDLDLGEELDEADVVQAPGLPLRAGKSLSKKMEQKMRKWSMERRPSTSPVSDFYGEADRAVRDVLMNVLCNISHVPVWQAYRELFEIDPEPVVTINQYCDYLDILNGFYKAASGSNAAVDDKPDFDTDEAVFIYDSSAVSAQAQNVLGFTIDEVLPKCKVIKSAWEDVQLNPFFKRLFGVPCDICGEASGGFRASNCIRCGKQLCSSCRVAQRRPRFGFRRPVPLCAACRDLEKQHDAEKWYAKAMADAASEDVALTTCIFDILPIVSPESLWKLIESCIDMRKRLHLTIKLLQLDFLEPPETVTVEIAFAKVLMDFALLPDNQHDHRWAMLSDALESLSETASLAETSGLEEAFHTQITNLAKRLYFELAEVGQALREDAEVKRRMESIQAAQSSDDFYKVNALLSDGDQLFNNLVAAYLLREDKRTATPLEALVTAAYTIPFYLVCGQEDPSIGFRQLENAYWSGWHMHENFEGAIVTTYLRLMDTGLWSPLQVLAAEASAPTAPELQSNAFKLLLTVSQLAPPDPTNPTWNGVSIQGRNMRPLRRYEAAIWKNYTQRKSADAKACALAYLDMLCVCEDQVEIVTCFLTAGMWCLKAVESAKKNRTTTYPLAKLLLFCTDAAMQLSFYAALPPPMLFYVARLAFGLTKRITEICEFEEAANSSKKHLESLLFYAPMTALFCPPIVAVSEAYLLRLAYTKVYRNFIERVADETDEEQRPFSRSKLDYFRYEASLKADSPDKDERKKIAMESLLSAQKLSPADVAWWMNCGFAKRDGAGWMLGGAQMSFKQGIRTLADVYGVTIKKSTGELRFLVEEASKNAHPLITTGDIATVFGGDNTCMFFSLDGPDERMRFHPYQCFRYQPATLQDTDVLATLFFTDYVLKQLAMGVEISATDPYWLRQVVSGVLKEASADVKHKFRSIHERGSQDNHMSRMWIQADDIDFDIDETEEEIKILVSNPTMTIRSKPLIPSTDGTLRDDDDDSDVDDEDKAARAERERPIQDFCTDLTTNYQLLSKCFPQFERLRKLCKMQIINALLLGVRKSLEEQARAEEPPASMMNAFERRKREIESEVQLKVSEMLSKIRREIRSTLDQHGWSHQDEAVSQLSTKFKSSYGIGWCNSAVKSWLKYDSDELRDLIVESQLKEMPTRSQFIAKVMKQFKEQSKSVTRAHEGLVASCQSALGTTEKKQAHWVPAIHTTLEHEKGHLSLYGGVLLNPKVKQASLSSPRNADLMSFSARRVETKASFQSAPSASAKTASSSSSSASGGGSNGGNDCGNSSPSASGKKKTRSKRSYTGRTRFFQIAVEVNEALRREGANHPLVKEYPHLKNMSSDEVAWLKNELRIYKRAKEGKLYRPNPEDPTKLELKRTYYLRLPGSRERVVDPETGQMKKGRFVASHDLAHLDGKESRKGYNYGPENVRLLPKEIHKAETHKQRLRDKLARNKDNA